MIRGTLLIMFSAGATYRQGVGDGSYSLINHSSIFHGPFHGQFKHFKGTEENQGVAKARTRLPSTLRIFTSTTTAPSTTRSASTTAPRRLLPAGAGATAQRKEGIPRRAAHIASTRRACRPQREAVPPPRNDTTAVDRRGMAGVPSGPPIRVGRQSGWTRAGGTMRPAVQVDPPDPQARGLAVVPQGQQPRGLAVDPSGLPARGPVVDPPGLLSRGLTVVPSPSGPQAQGRWSICRAYTPESTLRPGLDARPPGA